MSAGEKTVNKVRRSRNTLLGGSILGAAALAISTVAVPATADAQDRTVTSGMDTVSLAVSGQVNRALMLVGDGEDTTLFNADNNASSSRVRFIGEASPTADITAGAAIEVEFRVNNTFTLSQDQRGGIDDTAFRNRRVEVYFDHTDFGRVWLGMGWTATEFIAEQDLSGTAIAGYSDPRVMGGGMFFRDSTTGELDRSFRMLNVADNMDGFGRDTRIRYDTPRVNGFQIRTSLVNDEAFDVGLWYQDKIDRFQISSAIGWANDSRRIRGVDNQFQRPVQEFDDIISGSFSVLDDSGLNATFAAGRQDRRASGPDANFWYGKLGYQANMFPEMGTTAFSVDWHRSEDIAQAGDELDAIGFQIVQNVDWLGTEFYGAFRNHSFDRDGRSFDDLNIGMIGARVRF